MTHCSGSPAPTSSIRSGSARGPFGGRTARTEVPSRLVSTSARRTSPVLEPDGSSDPSTTPLGSRAPAARQVHDPSSRALVSSISMRRDTADQGTGYTALHRLGRCRRCGSTSGSTRPARSRGSPRGGSCRTAPERSLTVRWRSFSLAILHEDEPAVGRRGALARPAPGGRGGPQGGPRGPDRRPVRRARTAHPRRRGPVVPRGRRPRRAPACRSHLAERRGRRLDDGLIRASMDEASARSSGDDAGVPVIAWGRRRRAGRLLRADPHRAADGGRGRAALRLDHRDRVGRRVHRAQAGQVPTGAPGDRTRLAPD